MVELLKIGVVFLIILLLTFKKVKLWISLFIGTVLLGFFFSLSVKTIVIQISMSLLDQRTMLLMGSFIAILFFSNLLKETGRMKEILDGFRNILKDIRVVIALLPAIIGLMPIMGGALISAPMVVEGSDELNLTPERRTFINYWFRHLWEYILPTYPALVLAATLVGVSVRDLAWTNLPLTLIAIVSGILFGFWGVPKSKKVSKLSGAPSAWRLLINLFPLLFALTLIVGFQIELVYAFGLTIFGMVIFYQIGWPMLLRGFKGSFNIELLLTVAAVMGFKKVLESTQAIHIISEVLSSSGVPLWLVTILVPLITGLITGMTVAPIGISFPILIPLFQNDPHFLNYMGLAFVSGISGDLLSPFHLCLILTKDYFRANLRGVYRFLWIPTASLIGVGLLIAFFR